MDAYIKLQRKLLDWEWYSDINTKVVFLHCLLKANWKDGRFRGVDVPRGSFISGRKVMAEELGMSEQQIRTALSHLKSTNEITIKATSQYSIITVVNYDKYQSNDQQPNQRATNEQPTSNQPSTTIEEYKNIKKNKNNNIIFIRPSLEEVKEYCRERGNIVDAEAFINFYESKGWMVGKNKMKDWKAAVRTWEKNSKPTKSMSSDVGDHLLDDIERLYTPRRQ